jgi:hypothetical protein
LKYDNLMKFDRVMRSAMASAASAVASRRVAERGEPIFRIVAKETGLDAVQPEAPPRSQRLLDSNPNAIN